MAIEVQVNMSDLTLQFARKHVEHYTDTDDKLVLASRAAMDCYDCEAFLQLGIDAFEWLMRADLVVRKAIFNETYEYDPKLEEALEALCISWTKPCEDALAWVSIQRSRGFEVSNLDKFMECCEEMKAIVESFTEESEVPQSIVVLEKQAIQDHRDGQTAEFF